jgi:hypothetical protein
MSNGETYDGCESKGANEESSDERGVSLLTRALSYLRSISDVQDDFEMAEDPRLQQAFDLIRAVVADADKRATARVMQRLTNEVGDLSQETGPLFKSATITDAKADKPDKRAPHGSADALINRALREAGSAGLTVLGIGAKAESEYEKMVSTSAIRNWLRDCERKNPPKYRQIGGVWYLPQFVPTMKIVS